MPPRRPLPRPSRPPGPPGAALAALVAALVGAAPVARAEPDPRRKVVVLEHRAGSAALPGFAGRVAAALARQTSLTVLGHDQARAMYGEQLDQALVRCAGDAGCLARIGQRLAAAEVILVGVSELGDVILTMQRIDVASREVAGRVADSLAARAQPTDAQLAAYAQRLLPPTDFLRFGVIDVVANQDGALVTIDGERRGVTPIPALRLRAPGTYDVRVDKTGFMPFATRIALPPDSEIKVEAQLTRRGRDAAWYQHWYVLAAAGAIVAGAGATAVYYGTRPAPMAGGNGTITVDGSIK